MASQTTTALIDDLDGGKAVETIAFELDGVSYEIDLSAKNAKALRKAFDDFVPNARHIKPTPVRNTRGAANKAGRDRAQREQTAAIREWANQAGVEIAARGRISKDVLDLYRGAGN